MTRFGPSLEAFGQILTVVRLNIEQIKWSLTGYTKFKKISKTFLEAY